MTVRPSRSISVKVRTRWDGDRDLFMVSLELRDGPVATLTNREVFDAARDVLAVTHQAIHDGALVAKLVTGGRPRQTALLVANKARKKEHKATIGPILLSPGVDTVTLAPFVSVAIGSMVGRWTVVEADELSRDLFGAAATAERQTETRHVLIGMGMPDFQATNAVSDLDAYRQKHLGR